MVWQIHPDVQPPQFNDEVKAFAIGIALTEALKQTTELQDIQPDTIVLLGAKWQNLAHGLLHRLRNRCGSNIDDLLILAWRVNRFAHYYEAALIWKTADLSREMPADFDDVSVIAGKCEKHFDGGYLVARHYAVVVGNHEMLHGTELTKFPDTEVILEALSLDCVLHAALFMPSDIGKAIDLLADSASANHFALQGAQQLRNHLRSKAQRAANGQAGAKKRHSKMAELKAWTLEKYRAGSWKSANQAAHALTSQVMARSKEIGANLTESNAQRTIAEWIRKSA
jgi:hypothetical protein